MFQRGDHVLYGAHGVCQILGTEEKKIGSQKTEYYVLEPTDQPSARYYIPTHNQAAVAKLRPIITKQALMDMLHSADMQGDAWISDENQRKQHYCSLITGGDRTALVRMVHAIHKHKAQLDTSGRRLHLCDENFLRDAERLLNAEFALALNMEHDQVGLFVQSILDSETSISQI